MLTADNTVCAASFVSSKFGLADLLLHRKNVRRNLYSYGIYSISCDTKSNSVLISWNLAVSFWEGLEFLASTPQHLTPNPHVPT